MSNEKDTKALKVLEDLEIEAYNHVAHMTEEAFDDLRHAQIESEEWNDYTEFFTADIVCEDLNPKLVHLPILNPHQTKSTKEKWEKLCVEYHDLKKEEEDKMERCSYGQKSNYDLSLGIPILTCPKWI
ncbi:MAG: hypothetical protein GY941_26995 [Planctomycetes bacterium]|nr:hypothetical protein [Planctomycetota bacterium]